MELNWLFILIPIVLLALFIGGCSKKKEEDEGEEEPEPEPEPPKFPEQEFIDKFFKDSKYIYKRYEPSEGTVPHKWQVSDFTSDLYKKLDEFLKTKSGGVWTPKALGDFLKYPGNNRVFLTTWRSDIDVYLKLDYWEKAHEIYIDSATKEVYEKGCRNRDSNGNFFCDCDGFCALACYWILVKYGLAESVHFVGIYGENSKGKKYGHAVTIYQDIDNKWYAYSNNTWLRSTGFGYSNPLEVVMKFVYKLNRVQFIDPITGVIEVDIINRGEKENV